MSFEIANRDLAGILQGKVLEGPRHVVIDITNRCNTNCIACWTYSPLLQKENKPPKSWFKEEIEIDAFEAMIEDLAQMGVERIRFTGGGEPLLYREIERAIRAVKKHNIILAITTNGIILHKYIDLLKECRVEEIALSLWSASDQSYKAVHPKAKEGEFYRILESVRELRSGVFSPTVHILNVINQLNYHEISKMGDLGRNLGAEAVYFTVVDALDDTKGLVLTPEQRKSALLEVDRLKSRFYAPDEIRWDNLDGFEQRLREVEEEVQYDKTAVDELPCYMGWHFARVTASGDVAPCCRGVDYPMGNIHQHSFREIWSGDSYHEFRKLSMLEKKDHPYFKKMNCYQMCDNLMHNRQIQDRLESLSPSQREMLLNFQAPVLQSVFEPGSRNQ